MVRIESNDCKLDTPFVFFFVINGFAEAPAQTSHVPKFSTRLELPGTTSEDDNASSLLGQKVGIGQFFPKVCKELNQGRLLQLRIPLCRSHQFDKCLVVILVWFPTPQLLNKIHVALGLVYKVSTQTKFQDFGVRRVYARARRNRKWRG